MLAGAGGGGSLGLEGAEEEGEAAGHRPSEPPAERRQLLVVKEGRVDGLFFAGLLFWFGSFLGLGLGFVFFFGVF